MKKIIPSLLILAGAAMFSSCGLDELTDIAKNPIHVRGEADPNFGLPLVSGQVRLDELLGMLGTSGLGMDEYINQDSNTITLKYDIDLNDTIEAGSMISGSVSSTSPAPAPIHRPATKPGIATKGMIDLNDTVITYPLDITFFNDIDHEAVKPGNLAIEYLWLDFDATILGDCPDNVRTQIETMVRCRIDQIQIKYTTLNGNICTYHDAGLDALSIPINNILTPEGNTIPHQHMNLAEIIDSMPTHIEMSFRITFSVDESIYGTTWDEIMNFPAMMDSIGLTELYYSGNVHVEMPLSIKIGNLPFNFPVNLPEGTVPDINAMLDSIANGLDINIQNSSLFLALENHMPLDLNISARLKNDAGYLGGNIFSGKVLGAPVDAMGNVSGVADTVLKATVNSETLDHLARATELEVKLDLGTSRDPLGNAQFVRINKDDFLKIKMFANLHVGVNADIIVKE